MITILDILKYIILIMAEHHVVVGRYYVPYWVRLPHTCHNFSMASHLPRLLRQVVSHLLRLLGQVVSHLLLLVHTGITLATTLSGCLTLVTQHTTKVYPKIVKVQPTPNGMITYNFIRLQNELQSILSSL